MALLLTKALPKPRQCLLAAALDWLRDFHAFFLFSLSITENISAMINVDRGRVGKWGGVPSWTFKMEILLPLMGRYLSPIIIPMARGHLDVN